MEVRTAVSVNPVVNLFRRSILVDHYNQANRIPVRKEVAYRRLGYTGRVMKMVCSSEWADSSIYETQYIPVHVIAEYENFIVLEVLPHYADRTRISESYVTTINKHDIYRGRVDLID